MLAKNERSGTNPYNNKILVRMSRGEYLLNPDMEMMVNDRCMNVYKLMDLDKPDILSVNRPAVQHIRQERGNRVKDRRMRIQMIRVS